MKGKKKKKGRRRRKLERRRVRREGKEKRKGENVVRGIDGSLGGAHERLVRSERGHLGANLTKEALDSEVFDSVVGGRKRNE